MKKDVLNKYGFLDVLPYYAAIAPYLKKFLKGKEIATKIRLPNFFFLKRGSKEKPLYIEDFSAVNEKMLKLRKVDLKTARQELNEKQILIWEYFVPRKLMDFFYATNAAGNGTPIKLVKNAAVGGSKLSVSARKK